MANRTVGFNPAHPRIYRIYNVLIGSALLIVALPTMLMIAVAMRVTQGRHILYRGERLGQNGTTFEIFKFRTLDSAQAAVLTSDRTLPANADIFTPMGRFLRDSRLDELPQLFNVVRGDMNLCGPRPVRAEIRNLHAAEIPGYDDRFSVRPGLLGPTQAYFGHGASKRLRAKMNSACVRRPVDYVAELMFIIRVIFAMITKLVIGLLPSNVAAFFCIAGTRDIYLVGPNNSAAIELEMISSDKMAVHGVDLAAGEQSVIVRMRSGAVRAARVNLWPSDRQGIYTFEAANDYSAYVIERYAFGKAVLRPPVNLVPTQAPVAARLRDMLRERITVRSH